jgi:hypothetical protein
MAHGLVILPAAGSRFFTTSTSPPALAAAGFSIRTSRCGGKLNNTTFSRSRSKYERRQCFLNPTIIRFALQRYPDPCPPPADIRSPTQ